MSDEEPSIASAEVVGRGEVPVVRLSGELDLSSVEAVRPALDEALAGKPQRIVIDLSDLAFMDSSGIALLLTVSNSVQKVELRSASPIVRRIIDTTGLGGTFEMS